MNNHNNYSNSNNKAIFLDRDGVINQDHGYVYQPKDFHFIDGVFEACRYFQAQGYKLIVVTNQSGIARGYYTEAQFLALTEWVKAQFAAQHVHLDAVYFCPHHPSKGQGEYLQHCQCRKPATGMLQKGIEAFSLNPARCIMVGDKHSDMQAAQAANIGTKVLVRSGQQFEQSVLQDADLVCDSLAQLPQLLTR